MPQNKLKPAQSNKLIVIVGPTASGKTGLALELAKIHNGEIICADSRTIYRYMDIGTAKPTPDEQQTVPHHLLDVVNPNEQFNVVEFKTLCEKTIIDIRNRGKVPFMVGGSGMYVDSVLFDYQFRAGNDKLEISNLSYDEKLAKARAIYPREIVKIDVKNERRLDQLLQLGPANTNDRKSIKIECKVLGMGKNKPLLKQNIEYRTAQMLNKGIVQETEKIISKFGRDCPGLNTIGYKQCVEYIDGKLPESELANAINRATLDLAKRQMTWFKRNIGIEWLDSDEEARLIVANYLAGV